MISINLHSLPDIIPFLTTRSQDEFYVDFYDCRLIDHDDVYEIATALLCFRSLLTALFGDPDCFAEQCFQCRDLFQAGWDTYPQLMAHSLNNGRFYDDGYETTYLHHLFMTGDAALISMALLLPGLQLDEIDDQGNRPVDLITCITEVMVKIAIVHLKRLILSGPVSFLNNLAVELDIEPDPAIEQQARSNPDSFAITLCSIIDIHRHRLLEIEHLLCDAEEFNGHNTDSWVSEISGRSLKKRRGRNSNRTTLIYQ